MLIHHFLRDAAERNPSKNAIWFKDTWLSYGEIDLRSRSLSWWLHDHGIHKGDRVGILLENSFDYIIAYYGILACGAVVVALNTDTTPDMVSWLLNHSETAAVITSQKFHKFLFPAITELPKLRFILTDNPPSENLIIPSPVRIEDITKVYAAGINGTVNTRIIDVDLAAIVYTSGSTGKPKGVMLSHLNMVANTRSIVEYLNITSEDRIMVVLPMYYVYGKSLLNTHFCAGASLVIDNRFAYPNVILDTMEKLEVTGFAGVPSTYMILLSKSSLAKRTFPHLRYVTQAGGGMAVSIQKEVAKAFKDAEVFIMYGATELSPRLTYLPPSRLHEKAGSIGIPIPNADAFIANDSGEPLGVREEGQVVGKGSNIMMGYWKDPEGTAKVVRKGLYFTGDRGYIDEDGYLYVVGRASDMLKIGGNRVSVREIEDALLEIDFVAEAAVIGVADTVLGEAAKAFVVVRDPAQAITDEIFKNALITKLPSYKFPKFFQVVKNIPKTESGKIKKSELEKSALP